MADQAPTIQSLMTLIMWNCINVKSCINPRFKILLPSHERLSTLVRLANFQFCSGLLDILQSSSPPSLQWVKSLATDVPKLAWGVYILVLEKSHCRPLIYIGSGTAVERGIRARLGDYKNHKNIPFLVSKALLDGYKIKHIALLAECPVPSPENIPLLRTVVVVLEAALNFVFWSMNSCTKFYGFNASLLLWPRDLYEWHGLCSHSPLLEALIGVGSDDFTPQQLIDMAATTKENQRLKDQRIKLALRTNPTEKYKARQKVNNVKQRPRTKAREQAAVENQQYHCIFCNVSCRDNATLARHNATKGHIKRATQGNEDFFCSPCNRSFRYQSALNAHQKLKWHLENVKE